MTIKDRILSPKYDLYEENKLKKKLSKIGFKGVQSILLSERIQMHTLLTKKDNKSTKRQPNHPQPNK